MDAEKFDPLAAAALVLLLLLAQISRKRVNEEAEENGPTSMDRLMSTLLLDIVVLRHPISIQTETPNLPR